MKKKNTWSIRRLFDKSHRPSEPAYYIVDCWIFTNLQVLLLPKQKSLLVLRRDLDVSIVCRFSHNGFSDHICVVLIWSYTVHVLIQDSYFLFIVPASGAKKIKIIKISNMELGLQDLGTILENGFGDHICVVMIWSYTGHVLYRIAFHCPSQRG